MRLVPGTEAEQLRSSVRKMLADHCAPARVREVMDSPEGHDIPLWRRISGELGLAGLVVPERHGGSGAGHFERAIVLEELGRALAPVPYLASAVLAVDAVLALDDDKLTADLLPRLASGELIGTVAAGWSDSPEVLSGSARNVVSGDLADVVLVYANTPDGHAWFRTSGAGRKAMHTLDPTRRLARLDFDGTSAERVECADPEAVWEKVRDLAAVALAAESVGGMSKVLETTVEYAKVRVQFGRPIGSYQAVKHGCADMYSAYEQAVSLARYAAWTADAAPDELPLAAATAQEFIGPAYFKAAADSVQLHGGIGYTWEHDAHLYYKRAKTSELLLGDPAARRARLADRLAI
ncbi:acyl-CoA dehydrogenase [Amycolatopsis sp. K13G38]|uniref:Acyl-CoA dehydrogenase n=1 Tax=Amycolatopsis acididurans TaxID=2724524 RepID=A0ABX1IYW9_9PSEU|nr:acyl-CoA dehydrogenase family protein [Amycolatopsis acididurans]NKQ52701.1 acyl-CoA dehydrogenase [Amycolatopsis acididurans]